jgi:hypothetical protein
MIPIMFPCIFHPDELDTTWLVRTNGPITDEHPVIVACAECFRLHGAPGYREADTDESIEAGADYFMYAAGDDGSQKRNIYLSSAEAAADAVKTARAYPGRTVRLSETRQGGSLLLTVRWGDTYIVTSRIVASKTGATLAVCVVPLEATDTAATLLRAGDAMAWSDAGYRLLIRFAGRPESILSGGLDIGGHRWIERYPDGRDADNLRKLPEWS